MTSPTDEKFRRAADNLLIALLFLTPFSKAAAEICFPLLLVAWLLAWRRPLKPMRALEATGTASWVWLSVALYVGLGALSILYSTHPDHSLKGFIRKTLEYTLEFVIAADLARRATVAERSAKALIGAAWLVILYGLLQEWLIHHSLYQSTVVDPLTGKTLHYVRMVGPYENPNDLATFLMVVALIVIGLLTGPLPMRTRLHLIFLSAATVGCLAWTQSLGALIGFAGGVGVIVLASIRRARVWLLLGGSLAAVCAFFFFIAREHVREILTLADIASQERVTMWTTALQMIRARPFLGHGLNTFMANYNQYAGDPNLWPAYAHNCYLQIAAETGLAGLAAFLAFVVSLSAVCWKAARSPVPAASLMLGLLAGVVSFLIQSFFDTNLYALRQAVLFWTLSGVALGLGLRILRCGPSGRSARSC